MLRKKGHCVVTPEASPMHSLAREWTCLPFVERSMRKMQGLKPISPFGGELPPTRIACKLYSHILRTLIVIFVL